MDKQAIIDHCSKIRTDVEDGNLNAIKGYIELYEMEKIIGELRKEIGGLALDAREMIGEKVWVQEGYEVSAVTTTRFKYPDDDTMSRHKLAIKAREDNMKQAYYSSRNGRDFFDEYGEIVEPAIPTTTTYLKLKWDGYRKQN
tara:strand:- start:106 stop:531 length:426 start_codon:yes stop_codon:yes gene_type:complete